MKYLIFNDLFYSLGKHKKLVIFYIAIPIIYLLFNAYMKIIINQDFFDSILAINVDYRISGWLSMLLYLFYIFVYIYIMILLFAKDLKNGSENIFLRMSPIKWIMCKMLSIMIIDFILLILLYLSIIMIFISLNFFVENLIILFLKNYAYFLLVQNIILLIFIIYKKYPKIVLLLSFIGVVCVNTIPTNIRLCNVVYMFIIYIMVLCCTCVAYRKLYIHVFENS